MTVHKVKLTMDRNGRVDSISPEAIVAKPGDTVRYTMVAPESGTNWRFFGAQLNGYQDDFRYLKITRNGRRLELFEKSDRKDHRYVPITLLYTLQRNTFYGHGPVAGVEPTAIASMPVKAYDPLIINRD